MNKSIKIEEVVGDEEGKWKSAQRQFSSMEDIVVYFRQQPTKLIAYVKRAVERKARIPGAHINQFMESFNPDKPFFIGGIARKKLRQKGAVAPARIEGIQTMLVLALQRRPHSGPRFYREI